MAAAGEEEGHGQVKEEEEPWLEAGEERVQRPEQLLASLWL